MISERMTPRAVSGLEESTRHSSPSARQYPAVSSRQATRSGRTTPSSRLTLIPVVVPLEARRKRIVSTWSEAVWPVARSRPALTA